MLDTIIKGTGNSRSIKSVPNLAALAPTYADLLALLTGDGLPVDILGLNPTGVQVQGTDLTKANLLTDETAALYGKGTNATPNEILAAIFSKFSPLLSGSVAVGSYTGSSSVSNPASGKYVYTPWANKPVGFTPKCVIITIENDFPYDRTSYHEYLQYGIFGADTPISMIANGTKMVVGEIQSGGFRVRNAIYHTGGTYTYDYMARLEYSSFIYHWIAFK